MVGWEQRLLARHERAADSERKMMQPGGVTLVGFVRGQRLNLGDSAFRSSDHTPVQTRERR